MKSKSFVLLYKKNKFKYCTCLLLPDITTIIRLCLYFSISLICEMTEMYLVWVFMLLLWYKRRNNYWYYHNSAPILWSASQLRQWLAPILSVFSFQACESSPSKSRCESSTNLSAGSRTPILFCFSQHHAVSLEWAQRQEQAKQQSQAPRLLQVSIHCAHILNASSTSNACVAFW